MCPMFRFPKPHTSRFWRLALNAIVGVLPIPGAQENRSLNDLVFSP